MPGSTDRFRRRSTNRFRSVAGGLSIEPIIDFKKTFCRGAGHVVERDFQG
jgi:hypothetical protein